MTRTSYFATVLAVGALMTACDSENSHGPRRTGVSQTTTTVVEEQRRPVPVRDDTAVVRERVVETDLEEVKVDTIPTPPPAPTGNPDYAIKVPGKQGFVRSPYSKDDRLIDVRGLPAGTEAKDPYTDRTFLVP